MAKIGCTTSPGLAANEDISSNDRENEKRGQAKLERAIAMARDVGATHVCGILDSAFRKYDKPTTPEGVKRSAEVLQRVAEGAAKSNIILGLEVVNRHESNVLSTASQAVEMCKRIGAPNVKAHLDVYHMNIEESASGGRSSRQATISAISTPAIPIAATWARGRSILPACFERW
jgi:D-psicose/D-tagatose/L-ribulose 3-epimerase